MSTKEMNSPELHLIAEDGVPLVMPGFGIVLFTGEPLSKHREAVLGAQAIFETFCPSSEWTFYRTENMSTRKKATARTADLLSTWLKPGAPKREWIVLDVNRGGTWDATSEWNLSVHGCEVKLRDPDEQEDANWIYMTMPLQMMMDRLPELQDAAMRLFSSLPFVSGYAGPTLEGSLYSEEEADRFAWKTVMRYRGFEYVEPYADSSAVLQDGLRAVNWLTFVGQKMANELGGEEQLRRRVANAAEVLPLSTGLCLKAGARPELGDFFLGERLAAYESVFRACEPAIARVDERYSPFRLDNDRRENTTKFLRRLAYEDE